MSLMNFLVRRLSPIVCSAVILLMADPHSGLAQGVNDTTVVSHFMELSLSADATECLGSPSPLHVRPGDWLTLAARGTRVVDVSWDSAEVAFNKLPTKKGNQKKNLAQNPKLKRTGPFSKGAAFTFKINKAIQDTTEYDLKVTCPSPDDPPKVIVDP